MRDLKVSLSWLVSMANSPEREQCPDTIHETAIHNTERAIEAERKLEELLDELQKTEQSLQNAWAAFVEKEKEVENLKSLAQEIMDALDYACRLASDYRTEAKYRVAVRREYTE